MNSQVRIDSFPSTGEITEVTGRSGHLISTEKIISTDFEGIFYTHEEIDEFEYDGDPEVQARNRPAHLSNSVFVQTDEPIVNKSISSLKFKPMTCQNDIQTFPAEQASMLPYLCEDRCRRNAFYDKGQSIITADVNGVGNWTDMDGADVAAPDNNDHYRYYPHEQGQLFLTIEKNDEKRDDHVEDEIDVFDNVLQIVPSYADGGPTHPDNGLRFTLITNADNVNPGADEVASGLSYFDVEFDPALDVFRTKLNKYELKIGVNYLQLVLPGGANDAVAGEMRLPLQYNLQLSFDVHGKAKTRAIDFNGEDISEQVRVGAFYRMVLYDETNLWVQTTRSPSYTADGQGVAHNYDIRQFAGGRAARIVLYLPIRQYVQNSKILPLKMNLVQHRLLDGIKNPDVLVADADKLTVPDVTSQHALLSIRNRNILSEPGFSGPGFPFEQTTLIAESTGEVKPLWIFEGGANDGTHDGLFFRRMSGFIFTQGTALFNQVNRIRTNNDAQAGDVFMFTMKNTYEPQFINAGLATFLNDLNDVPTISNGALVDLSVALNLPVFDRAAYLAAIRAEYTGDPANLAIFEAGLAAATDPEIQELAEETLDLPNLGGFDRDAFVLRIRQRLGVYDLEYFNARVAGVAAPPSPATDVQILAYSANNVDFPDLQIPFDDAAFRAQTTLHLATAVTDWDTGALTNVGYTNTVIDTIANTLLDLDLPGPYDRATFIAAIQQAYAQGNQADAAALANFNDRIGVTDVVLIAFGDKHCGKWRVGHGSWKRGPTDRPGRSGLSQCERSTSIFCGDHSRNCSKTGRIRWCERTI